MCPRLICLISVEVRLGYCKRPHMATVDMNIINILLAYNAVDQLTCSELRENTQLSEADLFKLIQQLIDYKILLSPVIIVFNKWSLQYCFVILSCYTLTTNIASDLSEFKGHMQLLIAERTLWKSFISDSNTNSFAPPRIKFLQPAV